MPLQAPKKNQATGVYELALSPPLKSPSLVRDVNTWALTPEWVSWGSTTRAALLGELLSHGSWFSRPPRRDTLEPLFAPWTGRRSSEPDEQFFCKQPDCSPGSATWLLMGLTMTATAIAPVWAIADFTAAPEEDRISLFGDGETVDGSGEEDEKEIHLEEIEAASPAAPVKMRNREWEARKFMAKERVREARLKSQIAERIAIKEESRFYAQFGDLEDGESHFSEYDLTDDEDEESIASSPSQP